MINLKVNGKRYALEASDKMPLLWALRDILELTGTKYGCGKGLCGACTIHIDGEAIRSCTTTVGMAVGKEISTIEGKQNNAILQAVQEAWIAEDVPQCGYCQSGQIMSATALLSNNKNPNDATINEVMKGNLCRCGTYLRIRKAIKRAAEKLG
ncbi:(2Fe-2S)-binding protein [Spongiimicrobium sp. 3-5]|uniref:(2Fe-2S)-binding protein n=1 Tax=Spongiimicrobium sp. 3-5 TaxID=3332596 RepID=UPI00397F81DF